MSDDQEEIDRNTWGYVSKAWWQVITLTRKADGVMAGYLTSG